MSQQAAVLDMNATSSKMGNYRVYGTRSKMELSSRESLLAANGN